MTRNFAPLERTSEIVGDYLLLKIAGRHACGKKRECLHGIFTSVVGVKLPLSCRFRDVLRSRRSGRNEHERFQACRPLRCQELSDFPAHRVADQYVSISTRARPCRKNFRNVGYTLPVLLFYRTSSGLRYLPLWKSPAITPGSHG
jgi:hypothetical protein